MKRPKCGLLYTIKVVLDIVPVLFCLSAALWSQGCWFASDREVTGTLSMRLQQLCYSPGITQVALFILISHIYQSEMLRRLGRAVHWC